MAEIGARASGYANALFAVARAEGSLESVEDELFRIARTIEGNDQLRTVLSDAAIPVDSRTGVVEELLKGAHQITRSLVAFVVSAGRAKDLTDIVNEFLKLAAAERQHEVAEVTSAVPLDQTQTQRLAEALSSATGKQIEVRVLVDPYVLGGVRARIGDRVIDGTVRTRLRQLRDTL